MTGTASYSAMTTKIRAMESQLLSDADFWELASFTRISDALTFLKHHQAYARLLSGFDEGQLHRGDVERLLSSAIFDDFQKIYYFANRQQRRTIRLLLSRYIPDMIRHCLYDVLDGHCCTAQDLYSHPFFIKKIGIPVREVLNSSSVEELIQALQGTGFDIPLRTVYESLDASLLNYEIALDMYYNSRLWKEKGKYLSGTDLTTIEHSVGSTLDLMNLQWIYRCKRYFLLSSVNIFSMLIPVHYKIKKEELRQLAETATTEEFLTAFSDSYYGKKYEDYVPEKFDRGQLEQMQKQILNKIYLLDRRNHPYSIAMINSYIYKKELEISNVITTLEGIRYSLNTNEIINYITT